MRRIALLSTVALLAACGGSSAPTGASITGTVGTASFTSASQLAVVQASDACTITLAPVAIGVSLAEVVVTNATATCSQLDTSCVPNSLNLGLIITKVHVPNAAYPTPAAPAFTTGSYTFANLANPDPTTLAPDPVTGNISIFAGAVVANGAAPLCDPTGAYGVSGGTLTVSSVSGTTITGSVSVNLVVLGTTTAAGSLSGTFTTATACTMTPPQTACQMLNGVLP